MRDCRVVKGGATGGERGKKTCFNCGGDDHAARDCKAPNSNFKYAVCFTCGETGHLVRDCPNNKQGIYINGGACKICKGTDHLATDCPSKDKCLRCGEKGHVSSQCPAENSGKFVPARKVRKGRGAAPGGVYGGDDLEDDFEDELGDVPVGKGSGGDDENENGDDGDADDDAPDAADLEWERTQDGTVLKDHGSGKKKRASEVGKSDKKEKKAKKPRVVEF